MATLLSYFAQASCCMAVFYLLYVLVFRRETFYRYNRLLLLSAFLFSAILPLLPLPSLRTMTVEAPGQQVIVQLHDMPATTLPAATQATPDKFSIGLPQLIMGLYAGVAITLFLVYMVQLLRIARLIKKGNVLRHNGYSFVQLPGLTTPFSFFHYIFIDTNSYDPTDLQHVVEHEKAHVLQRHSIDNLVASICCCLFWLNPFSWLLKRSLQLNLEFLADGEKAISPVFFFTSAKQKSISDGFGINDYPLVLRSLAAQESGDQPAGFTTDSTIYSRFPGGKDAYSKFLARNIRYPRKAPENNTVAHIPVAFVVLPDGSIGDVRVKTVVNEENKVMVEEVTRVVKSFPKFQPSKSKKAESVTLIVGFNLEGVELKPLQGPKDDVVVIGYGAKKIK